MKELSTFRAFLKEELDLGFDTQIKTMPKKPGILLHELVTIGVFDVRDRKGVKLQPYHLIFGDSSLAIFNAFDTNEVAGLNRKGAEEHISKM